MILDKIISLAQGDEDIRAVVLEGSISTHFQVDELSDYDVNIFSRSYEKYLTDDRWMRQIGEVLIYQKEHFQFYEAIVPTRLVIFHNRERVDFSFWHLSLLSEIIRGDKIYESYKNGFQILVDKDSHAEKLHPPDGTGFRIMPPSRDKFLQTIYDFWFEAYCVARYLSRRDLWFAKRIEDSYIKDHLYKMALWHYQSENDWKPDPILHLEGKRFARWASPELIEDVKQCFSLYDVEGTWRSLFAMVELFSRIARETCARLGVLFPERVEQDLFDYLKYLMNRPISR